MPDDLRPLPRLPLDTAVTTSIQEGALVACVVSEPADGVHYATFLQTRTTLHYPSAAECSIYDKDLNGTFPDHASVQSVVIPVLQEFAKTTPRPPQFPRRT